MNNKMLHTVTYLLVIVGALNWGLVGAFNGFNLVETLLGSYPMLVQAVYVLVGLSAIVDLAMLHKGYCKVCGDKKGM